MKVVEAYTGEVAAVLPVGADLALQVKKRDFVGGDGDTWGRRNWEEDRRVRGAALKAVCNLLVNFSPLQKVGVTPDMRLKDGDAVC